MIIRDVVVEGRRADVAVDGGLVTAVGDGLPADGALSIDGRGGALLPGLHDHHIHLLAAAAAAASVQCGPPAVHTPRELAAALRSAPGAGWVRGVGYDESVAGDLDRTGLDALVPERPVRVQHRGGSLWTVNSLGLDLLGPHAPTDGRLWRRDDWLRERLGGSPPSLADLGRRLAGHGVTGVTDATPGDARALAAASADLPQRLITLGDVTGTGLVAGPQKIVIGDHHLPDYEELVAAIRTSHDADRPVAVHVVTRVALALLLAVLDEVGTLPGDRVEHAAVTPASAIGSLADKGIPVVTQPSLIALRGDDYLARVDPGDLPDLWRYGTLTAAGVEVVCSSDAPYGELDPWAALRAARDRTTASGRVLGLAERIEPDEALGGYLAAPCLGARRRVEPGAVADLVLLDAPLPVVLQDPDSRHVVRTLVGGCTVYDRDAHPNPPEQ